MVSEVASVDCAYEIAGITNAASMHAIKKRVVLFMGMAKINGCLHGGLRGSPLKKIFYRPLTTAMPLLVYPMQPDCRHDSENEQCTE